MKKIFIPMIFLILLIGCAKKTEDSVPAFELDAIMTKRAAQRKERSIKILKENEIPYSEQLAPLPDENTMKSRTKDEVVYRTICLAIVAIKGDGRDNNAYEEKIEEIRAKYKIDKYFTPQEKVFIENNNPDEDEAALFSWRYEAFYVLLWALNYVEELNFPEKVCNVEEVLGFLLNQKNKDFAAKAKLRPLTQILDETDLIYRCHWAIVEAGMNNQAAPGGLSQDVVYERHYALNWLIRYKNAEWDDVTPDA